jgi:hypothetical protein
MTKYQLNTLLSFIEHSLDCAIYTAQGEQDSDAYKYSDDMRKLLELELIEMVETTNWDGK